MRASPSSVSSTLRCLRSPSSGTLRLTQPSLSSARTIRLTTDAVTPSFRRSSLWYRACEEPRRDAGPMRAYSMSKRAAVRPKDARSLRVPRRTPWNARFVPKVI